MIQGYIFRLSVDTHVIHISGFLTSTARVFTPSMNKELPASYKPHSIVQDIRQSDPIDLSINYDAAWLKGKTILITGGASGFGAGFVKKWAAHGATIVIGDINIKGAEQLVSETRAETSNTDVHFVYCNVTDWQSQVNFFKEGVKLSLHGGIDVVVANAGIAGADDFEIPRNLDADAPPKPNLKTLEVNLIGVLYTTHLALFWLPKNPGSRVCSKNNDPTNSPRDRQLLLLGSMASLSPIPAQALYAVSKHGVLGLYRTIRSTSWIHGIRVNLLCPYFIDTPILPATAKAILAGGAMGKPEDVIEAATRFTADSRIIGRSLYIGPKMTVVQDKEGDYQLALKGQSGHQTAVWEAYAHDYEDSEIFGRNIIRLLNNITMMRGWLGYFHDMFRALKFGLGSGRRSLLGKAS